MNDRVDMTSEALVEKIIELADAKQAANIVSLQIHKKSAIADYFVICEGNSPPQLKAIVGSITDGIKESDQRTPVRVDGMDTREWIVMDYGDVIVHVFLPTVRQHFGLEELWRTR